MRLSMMVLYEFLEKNYSWIQWSGTEEFPHLKGVIYYHGVEQLKEQDLLYVGCLNDMKEEVEKGNGFYGICTMREKTGTDYIKRQKSQKILYISEDDSIPIVCNKVQGLFLYYQDWEEKLHKALMNHTEIEMLCKLSGHIFYNMIHVYDRNLFLLGSANEKHSEVIWEDDKDTGKKVLSMETINNFKYEKKFKDTMSTRGVQMYDDDFSPERVMYINLWEGDQYVGRLCISETNRKFTMTDQEMAKNLAEYIRCSLKWDNDRNDQESRILESIFIKLLDDKIVDEHSLSYRLNGYDWKRHDRYICIRIKMDERDFKISSGEVTCHKLEIQFPYSFAFLYEESILMLVNTTKMDTQLQKFYSSFIIFLREGVFKAGISMVSDDFFQIREYYEQSNIALEVGQKADPMFWCYKFEDYVAAYVLIKGMKGYPARMFCPEGLTKLMAYDDTHRSELLHTLKIYLESNMNIAHASEKLYIHRSTLLYRIERIQKISGLDLQNPEIRFRILISLHLLKYEDIQ